MAITYGIKKQKQSNMFYTLITSLLLCAIFLTTLGFLYTKTKDNAYEDLHVQTKQIKDNLVLQIQSDNENLVTMANFAGKLHASGADYSMMFDSFKPIGLFSRIGILTPDCVFITKDERVDLSDSMSFEEEAGLGKHITGRTYSYSRPDEEVIRSAVPIVVDGETVAIIYGVIKVENLAERYGQIVKELDAQLFVYDKVSGDMIVDTIHDELGNISFLKDRKYRDGSSYEQLASTDKGFVAFRSAYKNEDLYLHYSVIEEFGWVIAMGRYQNQVFAEARWLLQILMPISLLELGIIALYILQMMTRERRTNAVIECASNVRKELLETTDGQNNILDALVEVCEFAKARLAIFFDTHGAFYHYKGAQYEELMLSDKERNYFRSELIRYASDFYHKNNNAVNVLLIKPNGHMQKTNPAFYSFLKEHQLEEISLSATINHANHIAILATINSKRGAQARRLAEKISACFSMALYNKNHLDDTKKIAITDSLTGALNRVAFKSDVGAIDREKVTDFSCIYIDVNELHLCNNKYGHGAGDEMLLFIANTLKEVFYGHKVYRMGGDEFLVFCHNVKHDEVKKGIERFMELLKPRNYHVAVGMSYRSQNTNTEEMVREAEVRMYEAKAEYYQNKAQDSALDEADKEYVQVETGILEIDTMLSVLKENYNGIYRVSLSTDKARRILMPAYLKYNENEEHYSELFSKYVAESVESDYHRGVLSFLNYDALKRQLMEGKIPKIKYMKSDGKMVVLSVYRLGNGDGVVSDTLWVFAKE